MGGQGALECLFHAILKCFGEERHAVVYCFVGFWESRPLPDLHGEDTAVTENFHQDQDIARVCDGVASFGSKFAAQRAVVEYRLDIGVEIPRSSNV